MFKGNGDYTVVGSSGDVEVNARGFPTQVPFEKLPQLADTLFNLPPELFKASVDRPNTFSSLFSTKQAVFYEPGVYMFSGANHYKIVRNNVNVWDGRYLTDQNRLVRVTTDNIGMARLRIIEPFNTRFRVSSVERAFDWPEDTQY